MATQLQIRRGTAAQVAAFTGAEGEIVYNSTNDSLHTNDGATAGGFELARADLNNVSDADLNAALTGNTLSALTITTLTSEAATFSDSVTVLKTTADANLQVQTTFAGADARLSLYGHSTGTSQIRFGDEASVNVGLLTYNHANDSLTARVGGSDALTIDSAGAATFSGSVGIGAVSPARTLEITSADTVAQRWSNTGVNNYVEMGTTDGSVRFGTTGGAFTLLTGGDAAYAGETVALNIDANGSLDIGSPYPITGLRGARRLVLNDTDQGVDFVAYSSTNGIVADQYIGGYLFGNDDNNVTEDHFAGMWANSEGTGGSMTLRFAAGKANYETDTPQMMIDGLGNLLVGKTASAIGTAGTEIYGTGVITSTRAGNILDLNRLSTPGNIAQFRADGAIVGSIGVKGTDLTIGNTVTGLQFYDAGNALAPVNVTTNANTDGATDLGLAGARFKDLYLSGGVVFGTTGGSVSSRTLDDYEEGTWTPTLVGSTGSSGVTYTTQMGKYVRVGNVMTAEFSMKLSSKGTASGTVSIGGLPASVSNVECAGRPAYYANITLATGGSISLRWSGSNVLQLRQLSSTTATTVNISELDSNFDIRGSITAIVV